MQNIIDRISIFDVAEKLGVQLVGKGKLYHSPFRKDEHPSFSIYGNGKFFKDLATGQNGNVITFAALAKDISTKEAYKLLLSEFGDGSSEGFGGSRNSPHRYERAKFIKGEIDAPKELSWNDEYAETVAKRHSLSVKALRYAFELKCFGFARSQKTGAVWIISDEHKLAYQIRRMDGEKWKSKNDEFKAWTLKHSDCSYPLGLANAKDKHTVCLCEGSTDFLSCFHILLKLGMLKTHAPLAMLGASQKIGIQYLKEFSGKNVIIFADDDKAGRTAAMLWMNQLRDIAQIIMIPQHCDEWFLKNGKKVKDLNDQVRYAHEQGMELNPFSIGDEIHV